MPTQQDYIYLVFSKTGTWLARTIKHFTPSSYVHTSISFDDTFSRMYSFGRVNPDNPFSGGFVEENLFEGVYKKNDAAECKIYRVPVTRRQFNGLNRDIRFFYKHRHRYHYNFLGLFGVLVNRPLPRKNHYFCSQFVYMLLKKHGVLDIGKHPGLVQATDFFDLDNMTLIYEGNIKQFKKLRHELMRHFSRHEQLHGHEQVHGHQPLREHQPLFEHEPFHRH